MPSGESRDDRGVLAIWHVLAPGRQAEFEDWYLHEHLPERMDIPGFLFGRRSEIVSGTPGSFITYVTESVQTLSSPAFLARLGAPTPWTTKAMAETVAGMNRVVCRRVARIGEFRGNASVTLRFPTGPDVSAMTSLMAELAKIPTVVTSELWRNTEPPTAGATASGAWKLDCCLVIDTQRVADAERLASDLGAKFPDAEAWVYRALYQAGHAAS